jgi:hypothetical protein
MAHYAFLDENNIVTEVITGVDENEKLEGLTPEEWYGNFRGQRCIRTSYNHNIRKNFASPGFFYDEEKDAFIPISPFPSWILNEETCRWEPPIPKPTIPEGYHCTWLEEAVDWYVHILE